ncbi:MAG: NUDIX hydrolase [Clostridia bacterium]|nr:NUDIX hydrolase [Clostridia bacterium]
MELKETVISGEYIYKGAVINLKKETVALPDGNTALREVVEHPGGVCIAAITENKELILVKQYRAGVKDVLLEIPAGKLEKGENIELCGRRELEEETGFCAETFIKAHEIFLSPAYTEEKIYLYVAKELYRGNPNPDEDEFIETVAVPIEELKKMVAENKITDAKTIIAVLIAEKYI